MKLSIKAGATSQSVNIFIQDSSSTVGAGLSGLVFNTSGLIAYYTFTGANAGSTAITLATLAAVNSAYSSGGFKEIDATNMKGLYRLDIPNAAIASGNGRCVTIMLGGATNMAQLALEIELTGWDNQDGVHGGMSALPNTAVTTNASLITSGTGTDQLSVTSGIAQANVEQWDSVAIAEPSTDGIPDVNVLNIANAAVATSSAQLGVNVVKYNNQTAQTDANNFPKVDIEAINGSLYAATTLAENVENCLRGTCSGGTNTTAVVSTLSNPSSLTASGQLVGRTIIFDWDTSTAALQGQASNITASTTGATPTITFTALTGGTAPANGDTFSID